MGSVIPFRRPKREAGGAIQPPAVTGGVVQYPQVGDPVKSYGLPTRSAGLFDQDAPATTRGGTWTVGVTRWRYFGDDELSELLEALGCVGAGDSTLFRQVFSECERRGARDVKNPDWLDAGPLQALVRRDVEKYEGATPLAAEIGWDERIIRRVLTQTYVTEGFADRYCIATGRHLSEVYPHLYPDDERLWFGECPKCGTEGAHAILAEGPKRIDLQCRECGKRWLVESAEARAWRCRPKLEQRTMTEAQAREAHAYYMSTDSTTHHVASLYGVNSSTIWRSFTYYALPLKPPRRVIRPQDRAAGHLTTRAKGWVIRLKALRLREEEGLGGRRIAARLGVSHQGVLFSLKKLEATPAERRYCIDPECARYDASYPTPPADIVAVAPELARCPDCGGSGESGELWRTAS